MTLRAVIDALGSLPDQWVYIPAATRAIELATPCYCLSIDANELSPEEQDELDTYPETIGLSSFLCVSQLEDIAQNLRQQVPQSSDHDLVQAINYYWRHDAFINLVVLLAAWHNVALNLAPFCRWTLRNEAAQHRLGLR